MTLISLGFIKSVTLLMVNNTIFMICFRSYCMTRIFINIILGCIAFFMLLLVAVVITLLFS